MNTADTKNDIAKTTRQKMGKLLNQRVADSLDLFSQIKQAHWNVRGRQFIALHEFFDTIAAAATNWTDQIAERAIQLGTEVQGTVRAAAKVSSLKEYPLAMADGADHVDALSSALADYGAIVRKDIDTADEAGDADTSDLFTQISREVDKFIWMTEAHNDLRHGKAASQSR